MSNEYQPSPETEQQVDRAAAIISDLMDMLKDHPDYHGAGPIDEAYKFLLEYEALQELRLKREEIAELRFTQYTNDRLINKINHLALFRYDREALELSRRMRMLGGFAWRWASDEQFGPEHVEIYRPVDEEQPRA